MSSLEHYPHIINKISVLWGYPECFKYLETLALVTNRLEREGFPPEVFDEIFFLLSMHSILFPQIRDVWDNHV